MSNVRIISQDGKYDTPYEIMQIWACELAGSYQILGNMPADEVIVIATYTSKEKADKAMEELKYAYLSHNHLKLDKKVPKNVSPNILEGVFGVFQFPKDEEVKA